MRIVVDCFKQIKGVGKSIGIYNLTLNLLKNLVEYKKHTNNVKIKDTDLIVLGNEYNMVDFDIEGVEFVKINRYNPLNKVHCVIWELFGVSFVCKKLKADKIIFPRGFCALTHPVKDTIIIHDLIPFYYNEHFPDVFNKLENAYIMNRLKASAKSCNQIITISEASKKEIIEYCKVDEEKITVIYNGCNEMAYEGEREFSKRPYICALTSSLPHKNAIGIFNSYKKYCEIASQPLDLKVIGVDNVPEDFPSEITEHITCFKFIKENSELHRVIANSKVFLFLSLVEGFGFPPIEAMQLGVPVVCSGYSSLPEVVGDAAVLVNPERPDEVAIALNDLIVDRVKQDALVKKGKENVKRFSWDSRASLYWKVIIS